MTNFIGFDPAVISIGSFAFERGYCYQLAFWGGFPIDFLSTVIIYA